MNKTVIIVIVVILAVLGGIYVFYGATRTEISTSSQRDVVMEESIQNENATSSGVTDTQVLAGNLSKLYIFNKAAYDEALKSGKLVVLYYYANWCPICKAEVPKLYDVFNELSSDQVIGFRVNFNDNETDPDEVELAREQGVAYQHTKVLIKNGKRILKSPESWDKQRYLDEINKNL